MWSPGGKETTHINRGTDFDTTPSCLLTLALPLLLSLSLSSSSSPPSAFSFSFAAWSSQLFRCYLWMVTRENSATSCQGCAMAATLPSRRAADWTAQWRRRVCWTSLHVDGDTFLQPVFPSGWNVHLRPTNHSSDRWKFCRTGSDKLSLTR